MDELDILRNFTFARTTVGSKLVTGRALATEATGSIDAFATSAESRCASAFVDI